MSKPSPVSRSSRLRRIDPRRRTGLLGPARTDRPAHWSGPPCV